MADLTKIAKKWLAGGFSVMPVSSETKKPTQPTWREYQVKQMTPEVADVVFKDVTGLAVICGGPWRVFCFDIDTKYDLTSRLYEDLKKALPNKLLKKLYCQRTQSGGYHFICKVPSTRLIGNKGLAYRATTAYERDEVYQDNFRDPKTRDTALQKAFNDKVRVLLETRSGKPERGGGYFLTSPSKGYEHIYGKIQEITEEEFDTLTEVARSFNEVVTEERILKESEYKQVWKKTPFEHYGEEGDALQVLYDNGWTKVYSSGKDVKLLRPGQTTTTDSAIYDTERNMFFCFSTSTVFEANRGYNAASVYIIVEHEGDTVAAYKSLTSKGWGEK